MSCKLVVTCDVTMTTRSVTMTTRSSTVHIRFTVVRFTVASHLPGFFLSPKDPGKSDGYCRVQCQYSHMVLVLRNELLYTGVARRNISPKNEKMLHDMIHSTSPEMRFLRYNSSGLHFKVLKLVLKCSSQKYIGRCQGSQPF